MLSTLEKLFSPAAQSPNQDSNLPLLTTENNIKHELYEANRGYQGDIKTKKKQSLKKSWNWLTCLFIIFLISSAIYAFFIWEFHDHSKADKSGQVDTLKLISLFNRHGDRAPSDKLPLNDKHAERPLYFWPNGLHNLTSTGRLREYLIGLETRKNYKQFLDFDSSKILAFSSEIYRCRDSLTHFLKGLYDVGSTSSEFLSFLDECYDDDSGQTGKQHCNLPSGSGSANEWTKVNIDYKHNPATALSYDLLKRCNYGIEHKSPIDSNLMISESIRALKGVEKYKDLVKERYNLDFNFDSMSIWSTVNAEMNLLRSKTTIEYTDHFIDWIRSEASSSEDKSTVITLFQLAEEVSLLAQRDRVVGLSRLIQIGPLIESLVNSQLVALGYDYHHHHNSTDDIDKFQMYEETDDASYEERFRKWGKSESDLVKFLHGLKMSQYGHSARFELWEANKPTIRQRFPYIQVSMYNKESIRFEKIEYEPIEFGSICRKFFMKKYPNLSSKELENFYDPNFVVDTKFNCPFSLFLNLTADLILDRETIHELCDT